MLSLHTRNWSIAPARIADTDASILSVEATTSSNGQYPTTDPELRARFDAAGVLGNPPTIARKSYDRRA